MTFDLFNVYRLENAEGKGPFYGEQDNLEGILKPHVKSGDALEAMGYQPSIASVLYSIGFVCGWRTRTAYTDFFCEGGKREMYNRGYRCKVYRPKIALIVPGEQVLFLKPTQELLMEDHGAIGVIALSALLHKLSRSREDRDYALTLLTQSQSNN